MNPFERGWVTRPAGLSTGVRVAVDLPLERKLRLLLERRWLDAGEAPPKLDPRAYRSLAEWAWMQAGLLPAADPDLLIRAHGLHGRVRAVGGMLYGECTDGNSVLYRCKGDPGMPAMRALHGLAHRFTGGAWNLHHTEADVWLLTIALLICSRQLWRLGPDDYAERHPHAPRWLIDLCYGWLQDRQLLRLNQKIAGVVVRLEQVEHADRIYRLRQAALEVRGR